MSSQNLSHHAVASAEHNRLVARRWIDAFRARRRRRGLGRGNIEKGGSMMNGNTAHKLFAGSGLVVLAVLAAAASAQARISSVAGQVEQIAQPADARIGMLESDFFARAWNEAQGSELSAPLTVDATPSGPGGTLPAGTVVSSHMIHADKLGTAGAAQYTGSASFSTPILGIITTDPTLVASDFLGAPTLFSASGLERGPDAVNRDTATIDSINTTSISFTAAYATDEVRVLTRAYAFAGFYAPVNNPPVVNVVKAGSAVAVKFSLGGFQGYDIFAPNSPSSTATGCASDAQLDDIETTVTAGASSMSYDASTDTYVYVWKTDKAWATQCRTLIVTTADGASHTALFRFK